MQIWSVSLWPPCNLSRNQNCDSDFISHSNPTTVVFSTFLLLATNKNESCRTRRVIQLASGAVRAQVQQTVVTSLPPLTGWGDQSGQMLVWSQRLSGSLSSWPCFSPQCQGWDETCPGIRPCTRTLGHSLESCGPGMWQEENIYCEDSFRKSEMTTTKWKFNFEILFILKLKRI